MARSAFSFLLNDGLPPEPAGTDDRLLWRALHAGVHGVGRTAPNPAVGAAVRLSDGAVVEGHHARAGERHAEIVALDQVVGRARGATLACTLEPCVHHGRTPPCVDRIVAEGVARVIVGALDENPRVRGEGVKRLRSAGVDVIEAVGPLAEAAHALARPFFTSITRGRPYVVLKIASSLDGRVATKNGASRWITGPTARQLVHGLRDRCDAVCVGAATVSRDDPALTVRDVAGRDPIRVVLDRALSIRPTARVLPGAVVVHGGGSSEREDLLRSAGAELVVAPVTEGHLDLAAALALVAKKGAVSVLVEAGPGLATALVTQGLVDELWWFSAPILLGADGVPAIGPLGLGAPADAARWQVAERAVFDDDALTVLIACPGA